MSDIVRLSRKFLSEPVPELHVDQDAFSVKVHSPADPIFWVRLEDSGTNEIAVTDFNTGELAKEFLFEAFKMGIERLGKPRIDSLVFQDIAPGTPAPHQGPRLLSARMLAEEACEYLVKSLNRQIADIQLVDRRGKVDIRVSFQTRP